MSLDNLVVCIPLAELGYSRFWQMLVKNPDFGRLIAEGRVQTFSGPYVHNSHNKLVKDALKFEDWDRLLFLEHDHDFPDDVFQRHAAYTQPMVSGLYTLRTLDEPLPVIYNWDAGRQNALYPNMVRLKEMLDDRGLHEVDVVPMGCTSIRRDVFENWPKDHPWFSSYTNPSGSTISDDVWFCRLAQDMGYQPYVDTSLRVKHYSIHPIDDSYFVSWYNKVGVKQAIERATA